MFPNKRQRAAATYEGKLQGSCELIKGQQRLLHLHLQSNIPGRGFDSKNVRKIYPQAKIEPSNKTYVGLSMCFYRAALPRVA
jgi:hypothetical protein